MAIARQIRAAAPVMQQRIREASDRYGWGPVSVPAPDTPMDDYMNGGGMPSGPGGSLGPVSYGGGGFQGGFPSIPGLPPIGGGWDDWLTWGTDLIGGGCPEGSVRVPPIFGPCVGPGATRPHFPGPTTNGGIPSPQAPQGVGIGCPSGYRPNKSDYFLRDGTFVAKGTRCVKARRRNALNPRALDRAISRVSSAKKAAKKLGRITIRKKC